MSLKRSLTITDAPAAKRARSAPGSKKSFKRKSNNMVSSIFTRPELKQVETYSAQFNVGSAPVETFVSGIAEGTGATQREGRCISWKNIRFRIMFASQSTATIGTAIHWALVLDRQPNASTITYATVFDSSVVTDPAMRFKATTSFDARFKVIREGTEFVGLQSSNDAVKIIDQFVDLSKMLPC